MTETELKPEGDAPEKLKLLKSPLVQNEVEAQPDDEFATGFQQNIKPQSVEHLGYSRDGTIHPTLVRNSQAGNLETLYDLFLACLNIFNQNQKVDAVEALSAYVGFFTLIWTTWFVTGMYDVRFVTDSVFERCTRAVHLGVLMGFITVSPNFDPSDQDPRVFQTFSIILMVSRLCLVVQYAVIRWHTKSFKSTRVPMYLMMAVNFIAAAIYLGASFRFRDGGSRVFYFWYALGIGEIVLTIGFAMYFSILSFQGTHLVSRISLMTLIIFGEGISLACGKITDIIDVGSHEEWTKTTIGVVSAALATTYVVFMVYFDWMPSQSLNKWRQITWSLLHFPLHLTMTMFVEGCAELILMWKCVENTKIFDEIFDDKGVADDEAAEWLETGINKFLERWPSTYGASNAILNNATGELRQADYSDPAWFEWIEWQNHVLGVTLFNVLFHAYELDFVDDAIAEIRAEDPDKVFDLDDFIRAEETHYWKVQERFGIVFQYTFICAGCFLGVATLLYVVSRRARWTYWAAFRVFVNVLLAVGFGLIAHFAESDSMIKDSRTYMQSPFVIPTLLALYVFVLGANHLLGDGPNFSFFKSMKQRKREMRAREGEKIPQEAAPPHQVLGEETRYDPGAVSMPQPGAQLPRFNSYGSEFGTTLPTARPYSQLNLTAQQYAHYGQYAPAPQEAPLQAVYTTVYEYSGNDGPRPVQ